MLRISYIGNRCINVLGLLLIFVSCRESPKRTERERELSTIAGIVSGYEEKNIAPDSIRYTKENGLVFIRILPNDHFTYVTNDSKDLLETQDAINIVNFSSDYNMFYKVSPLIKDLEEEGYIVYRCVNLNSNADSVRVLLTTKSNRTFLGSASYKYFNDQWEKYD